MHYLTHSQLSKDAFIFLDWGGSNNLSWDFVFVLLFTNDEIFIFHRLKTHVYGLWINLYGYNIAVINLRKWSQCWCVAIMTCSVNAKAVFKDMLVYLMAAGCRLRQVVVVIDNYGTTPLVSAPEWIYWHNMRGCAKFWFSFVTAWNVPNWTGCA